MKILKYLVPFIFLPTFIFSQTVQGPTDVKGNFRVLPVHISQLPAASESRDVIRTIDDASGTDCIAAGGSTHRTCISDGTNWVPFGALTTSAQVFTTLYLPTQGSGLTLNIAAGRAFCGGSVVTYAGGTLTMTASVTNRVYLNTASSCVPAVRSTAFVGSDIPIASVVTSDSAITSVTDARTMFNQLLQASNVVGSINGSPGAFTFSGPGVSCTGTACTFTGGTFSNPMTTLGDMIVGGSAGSPQRLPVGSDGQVITADHTMTNGVKWATPNTFPLLLSSTSLVIWAGPDSTIGDDAGAFRHGTAIPMTGWTQSAGVCSFHSTAAHNLVLNEWFSTDAVGGWPAMVSPYAAWTSGLDLFQVASVVDSTHWTAACPLISATSGSYGNAENANYFLPFYAASLPFFKQATHKTVLPIGSTIVSMAANYSTTIHPLITSWLASNPGSTVLVELTGGRNDIQYCTSNATLKADLLAVAASIHADGGVVSMSTLTPQPWNTTDFGCHLAFFSANDLNNWVKSQLPNDTNTAPHCSTTCGQYFDRVIDVYGAINNLNNPYMYDSGGILSSALGMYAHMLNDYTATQTSLFSGYPDNIGSGVYGGSMFPGFGFAHYATSGGKFNETWWNQTGTGEMFGIDGSNGPYFPSVINTNCIGTNSQGYPVGTNCIIGWPASGLAASTGSAWRSPAYGDVVALFGGGSCSGFLKNDGTCTSASGGLADPGSNGVIKRTALNTTAAATFSDIVALWASGSCTAGYLKFDGTCSSPASYTATSPIVITGSVISCPTCGTGSGGSNVSQNSRAAETNLPITGFMPQTCSDTSASGTAQSCTVANTFIPQAGNCLVYETTTANSGAGLTVNINSLGAKSVAVAGASGWTTTLTASLSIPANKPINLCYDGTNWNASGTGYLPASAVPSKVNFTFNSTPVTLPGSVSAYQSNETVTLAANTYWSFNFGVARASTSDPIAFAIAANTSSCRYEYDAQTDGNEVLNTITSGGSSSVVGASGGSSLRDFVGDVDGFLIFQQDGVIGSLFAWGIQGHNSTSNTATNTACSMTGTFHVYLVAPSFSAIKGVQFSYPFGF